MAFSETREYFGVPDGWKVFFFCCWFVFNQRFSPDSLLILACGSGLGMVLLLSRCFKDTLYTLTELPDLFSITMATSYTHLLFVYLWGKGTI